MPSTKLLFAILSTVAVMAQGSKIDTPIQKSGSGRICPLPTCKGCPTKEQLVQPGIGFALDMGYGTVAIRHHDKTIQPVIQIQGSEDYKSLMRDLSQTTPLTRFPKEIPTLSGKLAYVRARLQRLANKAAGRPANAQTAVLAEMIAQLRTSAEGALVAEKSSASVTHAVISSPDSISLTDEELGDILDYLKITNSMEEPDDLYAAAAAYAGFGQGLCATYTKPYRCEREEQDLPFQRVLHLDFADEALTTTVKGMTSYKRMGVDASTIVPELGLDHDDDSDGLFKKIEQHIRNFVRSTGFRITEIIFTGTRAGDSRFKHAVTEALGDLVAENTTEIFEKAFAAQQESDFVFAAAKGAAEVAKRRLEGPVRCIWSNECENVDNAKEGKVEDENMEL